MQTGMEKSALEAVPKIIKNEGIGGIYAGFGVTVMREIHSAIQFPIYERLKDMWSDAQGHRVAPGNLLRAVPSPEASPPSRPRWT